MHLLPATARCSLTRQLLPRLASLLIAALSLSESIRPLFADVLADSARRPNVVLMLADDLGWRDLGCYGSTYHRTPQIDALAARGMRFTQAYSASPLCSPTRASIMTGLYPARIGITNPSCHLKELILKKTLADKAAPQIKALSAVSLTRLKPEYFTLAEALHAAGYRTGHFGKWHLGAEPYDPLHQGFDVDFPHYSGPGPAGGYIAPWKFPKELNVQGQPGEHIEDRVASEACQFIRANKDQPFFLNYWMFSVHSPWNAKPELVEQYRRSIDPNNPQRNPVYAAMIQSMDDGVGRVVRTLDELGLSENTIILFSSDNGGVDWHDAKMKESAGIVDPPTSNLPLRGGKASLYEGGTREPCLVVWPGMTQRGAVTDAMVQSTDFYPTLLAMCGVQLPANLKLDGRSFVPVLTGQATAARETLFCHFPHLNGNPADDPKTAAYVRQGDWKLIRRFCANEDLTDRYELFNLRDDLGEMNDLVAKFPERVSELAALLAQFLSDTEAVIPQPNPAYVRGDRWSAGAKAQVEYRDQMAVVTSSDDRPTLQILKTVETSGPVLARFRMRGRDGRNGLVLWGTDKAGGFAAERRMPFEPKYDGQWHDYEVRFTVAGTLRQLRIDGSLNPTTLEFQSVELCNPTGQVLQKWDFTAGN